MQTTTKKSRQINRPYSWLKIAFSYTVYFLKAKTKHIVHSPIVFGFCSQVLAKCRKLDYNEIEHLRKSYTRNTQTIDFVDFGKSGITYKKSISSIANRSLKPKKYAQLLAQSVIYFKSKSILELGTSLGITTAYLAKSTSGKVHTLEGDATIALVAKQGWDKCNLYTISQTIGNFDETLKHTLQYNRFDFIYLDGNHRLEPTLAYFELCLQYAGIDTVLVFDDIHYSFEMEQAWNIIKDHPKVQATIDVFFLGYVFIDPAITKKNYTLRF